MEYAYKMDMNDTNTYTNTDTNTDTNMTDFVNLEDYEVCVVSDIWNGRRWYTSHRINNQRSVCVEWEERKFKHSKKTVTVEPVCNLIDNNKQEIAEKMIPILYNWRLAAEKMQSNAFLCSFCDNRRLTGCHTCADCTKKTEWLKPLLREEGLKRNDGSELKATAEEIKAVSRLGEKGMATQREWIKTFDEHGEIYYINPSTKRYITKTVYNNTKNKRKIMNVENIHEVDKDVKKLAQKIEDGINLDIAE